MAAARTRQDFSRRSAEPELMDTERVPPEELARCLADLATVNVLTLARRPTLAWLAHATANLPKGAGFSLLDVGFGQGDMLRAIHRWARRRGLTPELSGIDMNPDAAAAARAATPPEMSIAYLTTDLFDHRPARPVDFIVSSLFAHHLNETQLTGFLRWMEANAARGWFVNDLHRHPLPYHVFRLASRAARWHRFVRNDGPVSIARAFRRDDWARVIRAAGLPEREVSVRWRVPFRLCVGRLK